MLLKIASLGSDSPAPDPIRAAVEKDHGRLCRHIAVLVFKTQGPMPRARIGEIVQEVLSETVRQALGHADDFDPSRPALPWLMGIAVNVVRGLRRQSSRDGRLVPESDLGDEVWQVLLSRTGADLGDRFDLREALARLDEKDRRALQLRYFEGRDGEELAQALGARTPGAARVRVCRALQALRALLGLADPEVKA